MIGRCICVANPTSRYMYMLSQSGGDDDDTEVRYLGVWHDSFIERNSGSGLPRMLTC